MCSGAVISEDRPVNAFNHPSGAPPHTILKLRAAMRPGLEKTTTNPKNRIMKKRNITLLTAIAAAAALAPAAQAQITIMDPTTNDGSFEGFTAGAPVNWGNRFYEDIWSNTDLIGEWNGGGNATYKTDGNNCLVVNGGPGNPSGTATSDDLLANASTTYTTVTEGDVFTYSWDYRPNTGGGQTFKFEIDFGNGPVELDSVTVALSSSYQTMSGTYTALAADASGGELAVVLSQDGHSWTDNVQLSVTSGTPPAADPEITSITSLGGGNFELTLKGGPSTTYEFYSSATLDFTSGGTLVPLTGGGTDVTTDGSGDATVEMSPGGSVNFVRAAVGP